MSNTNERILKQAIAQLPTYEAPSFVWEQIDEQLQELRKDDLIQDASQRLPSFEAPADLWLDIQQELETAKPKRLIPMWSRWAAAASIVLASAYWLTTQDWNNDNSFTYSEHTEQIDHYLRQNDWESDEAAFAEVVQMHEAYSKVFNDPESTELKVELQELEADRKELKDAIELYGNDHELIRQLANLERDRTELIKKMATKI